MVVVVRSNLHFYNIIQEKKKMNGIPELWKVVLDH